MVENDFPNGGTISLAERRDIWGEVKSVVINASLQNNRCPATLPCRKQLHPTAERRGGDASTTRPLRLAQSRTLVWSLRILCKGFLTQAKRSVVFR